MGRHTNVRAMMARPRLQSLGQDAPLATSPPRRDVDGGWRCRGLRVPLFRSTALRVMLFLHEYPCPLLNPSKPSAGLLCTLLPPFEVHAKFRNNCIQRHAISAWTKLEFSSKGGERLHRRLANSFYGSRRGQRHFIQSFSCRLQ